MGKSAYQISFPSKSNSVTTLTSYEELFIVAAALILAFICDKRFQPRTDFQKRIYIGLSMASLPMFIAFPIMVSTEPYIEILRPFVFHINTLRIFILLDALGEYYNIFGIDFNREMGQIRRIFYKTIGMSQIFLTLYFFCLFFPIKLTNAFMHALNGNIDRVEPQGNTYTSSIDDRGRLRNHRLANDHSKSWIPPVNVEHSFKWKTGDKILDSVYKFFQGTPEEKEYSESYKTCEEQKSTISEFLTSPTTITILFIAAMLLFIQIPNKLTKSIIVILIGTILGLKLTGTFDEFDSVGLLDIWYKLPKFDYDIDMEEVEPQGVMDYAPLFSTVLLTSISALSGYSAKKSVLNGLLQATKVTDIQTGNITTMLLTMCSKIHEFLKSLSHNEAAEYFEVESQVDANVRNFQTKVFKFCSAFNSGSPDSMLHCMDVYQNLYNEGKKLSGLVSKNSYDLRIITDATTKLLSVYQKLLDMEVSVSGERIEPVCVNLRGKPGVMKGVLNKRLAKVCAIATLPKEWRESYRQDNREFFFNVPTDSFWDTYTNKAWVTIYDDVFQRRDAVADSDADALKIIKMINCAPYNLKMAGVTQKNNTFFRSAFVFCTTNLENWTQIQSTTDYLAAKRRMHMDVEVKVNNKYLTPKGEVDKTLLPNDFSEESNDIPNDFWHLKLTETRGNTVLKPRIVTVKQLIKDIVARYQYHKMNFLVNRKSENKLIKQLSEEMGYEWEDEIEELVEPQGGLNDYEISFLGPLDSHTSHTREVYEAEYFKLCDNIGRIDLYGDGFYSAMKIYCEYNNHYELNKHINNREIFFIELEREFRMSLHLQRHPLTLRPEWHKDFETPKDGPITRLKSLFFAFKEFVSENLIFVLAGTFLSATALYYLSSFFDTVITNQSVDFKTMGKHKPGKKFVKLSVKGKSLTRVEAQGGIPPDFDFEGLPKFKSTDFGERNNQNDVICKIFNKYFYIMYVVDHSDGIVTRFGHVTNLRGQIFLAPFHFMFLLEIMVKKEDYQGATVVLTTSSGSNRYAVSVEEFMNSFKTSESAADNDVCILKLKCAQKFSKGAISNFLTREDYKNCLRSTTFSAELLGSYKLDRGAGISIRSKQTRASAMGGGLKVNATWDGEQFFYNLFDVLMYEVRANKGDCGSILLATDSNYENRFVIGMHTAGSDNYGYSVSTLQESLVELMETLFPEECYFEDEEEPLFLESTGLIEPQSGLAPIFNIKPPYTSIDMSKSNIKKSKLYSRLPGHEEVNTRPARLKEFVTEEGEIIDPLQMAFDKYGKHPPDIPSHFVDQAIESYESLLHQHFKTVPSERKVLTIKEALHSFENMNSINSSTSPGFPLNLSIEEDLKKAYYNAYNAGDIAATESAYQRIAFLVGLALDMYKSKIRPFFAYKQCGKDEPRSLKKFYSFMTRLFSACPFVLLILFRMYFGSFINDFIGANVDIGSAVGVNPYSEDWDAIARRLLQHLNHSEDEGVAAGDQGEYDTRQWTIIHNEVSSMINRYYPNASAEENYIRSALYMEITNSRHVFKNKIYIWFSGLPSGNPITAIINTIYNHITFRISWIVAELPIREFNTSVYLIVLGDDNGFSVIETYKEAFNEITLTYLMAEVGMKYTTEMKTISVKPFRKITEVEFLKRGFKHDKALNRWVAPLRLEAIFEMLNWTKKGKEGDQITLDNINFALRELSLHNKDLFEKWVFHFRELKGKLFPGQMSHGDMPCNFQNTYNAVLKEEFYF